MFRWLLIAVLLFAFSGCSSSNEQIKPTGTVTIQGTKADTTKRNPPPKIPD